MICPKCNESCVKTGHRQKHCQACAKVVLSIKVKAWRDAHAETIKGHNAARIIDPEKNRKRVREWAEANPEKAKALSVKWYKANKEKAIADATKWGANNRERRREINRESAKRLRASDPERFSTAKKERRKDPGVRLHDSCSAAIRISLKGNKGGASWERLVGYTLSQLKAHLGRGLVGGMNWENYGAWHVDHKRPVSSFAFSSASDQAFLDCWALSNLQPLWAVDNIRKGNKWTPLSST